jgi:hypothetical protein
MLRGLRRDRTACTNWRLIEVGGGEGRPGCTASRWDGLLPSGGGTKASRPGIKSPADGETPQAVLRHTTQLREL